MQPLSFAKSLLVPKSRLATAALRGHGSDVSEPLIEREEVIALLFDVSDIAALARRLLASLGEDDGEEEAEAD